LHPTEPGCGGFIESNAYARKKRGRGLGVGSGVQTRINGGKKGLLLGEGGTTGGTLTEMREQLS